MQMLFAHGLGCLTGTFGWTTTKPRLVTKGRLARARLLRLIEGSLVALARRIRLQVMNRHGGKSVRNRVNAARQWTMLMLELQRQ